MNDPLAYVEAGDRVSDELLGRVGDCPGTIAGDGMVLYCTRDRHPEEWAHIATDSGDRVCAVKRGGVVSVWDGIV